MNRLTVITFLTAALLSCTKDDPAPAFSFKNQNLTGKIGGTTWTYADGYSDVDGTTANITLTLAQEEAGCDMGIPEGNEVFFSVPQEVAVHKLSLNIGGTSQTITLLEHSTYFNHIATSGAVEILTITDSEITGRIDARSDSDNSVNGNFTVSICK